MKAIAVLLALTVCATAQEKRASVILRYQDHAQGPSYLGRIMFNQPLYDGASAIVAGTLNLAPGIYVARINQLIFRNSTITEPIGLDAINSDLPVVLLTITVESDGRHFIDTSPAYQPATLTVGPQGTSIVNKLLTLHKMDNESRFTLNTVASGIVLRMAIANLVLNNPPLIIDAGMLRIIQLDRTLKLTGYLCDLPPGPYEIAINGRNYVTTQSPIVLLVINMMYNYMFVDEVISSEKFGHTNYQQDNLVGHDISIYRRGEARLNDITQRVAFGPVY